MCPTVGALLHGGACGTVSLLGHHLQPPQTVQTHRIPGPQRVQLLQARPWLVLHVCRMQPLSWLSLCWDSVLYSCLSIIYVCMHCRYQSGFRVCISVAAVHVGGGG